MPALRNTVQKNQILNAVRRMKNHPTAEMICEELGNGYSISRATVYRNLNQLAVQEMIRKVAIPNEADRYDYRIDNHYHIRCIQCGKVMDADIPHMTELDHTPEHLKDIEIVGHHLVFDGICAECKNTVRK